MKFATIKSDGLAIVQNDTLIPITGVLRQGSTMIDLISPIRPNQRPAWPTSPPKEAAPSSRQAAQAAGRTAVEDLGRRRQLQARHRRTR